jgi:cysteinyl-tRNA synthetase
MSKSLGNFLMIKDVLKSYHPEAVRLFLLSNHYRSPIDFTDKAMDESSKGLDKIYALLERVEKKLGPIPVQDFEPGICWKHFCDAMDDDFNSALGIGIIFDTVRSFNRLLDQHENSLSSEVTQTLQSGLADIRRTGDMLGMFLENPTRYFNKKQTRVLEQKSIDPDVVAEMVEKREVARKVKNWEMADQIRKELLDMGIILEDRADGPVWKINK